MIELNTDIARNFISSALSLDSISHNFEIKKVAGDASFRSYYRIFIGDKTYILMFAPPSHEDIRPFIFVDEFLVDNGFSAPKIHAIDHENGFILLEDFGDETYNRALRKNAADELKLYQKACDFLVELHKITPPQDLPLYDFDVLMREVMLFPDWYALHHGHKFSDVEIEKYKTLWTQLFEKLDDKNQVVVLRDYHADNLMNLTDRKSLQQVGLLDFQDALTGSRAYDLVSLLEDARRDVNEQNRQKLFDQFVINSGYDQESFTTDYEILSLQRNVKILGIFCRLAIRDNKKQYLDLLPRVLAFVKNRINSSNPIFAEIGDFLHKFL